MLARIVPGPLVRWFARPYVAGAGIEAGLDTAVGLSERGLLSTLALLGEHVTDPAAALSFVRVHEAIIDAIAVDPRCSPGDRPALSIKPSAFTTGDPEDARPHFEALAERAKQNGVALTIDMEDRRWTDFTIDLATDLYRRGYDVGTVLQTRLHRTERDLARIPEGMRLRLVIGIYPEPADVALTDKRDMKERMLDYAGRLLDQGVCVEFASHDDAYVERFARDVAPRSPDRSEVQLLLGVPRDGLIERLRGGELGPSLPVRLYVPFAVSWKDAIAYLRRRMDESPNVMWLVLQNLKNRVA